MQIYYHFGLQEHGFHSLPVTPRCFWLSVKGGHPSHKKCSKDLQRLPQRSLDNSINLDKKLSCCWQTAQHICEYTMAWLGPTDKHAPPDMCCHAKYGCSISKGVSISVGYPKNGGTRPLEMGHGWPLKSCHTPYVLPRWI